MKGLRRRSRRSNGGKVNDPAGKLGEFSPRS